MLFETEIAKYELTRWLLHQAAINEVELAINGIGAGTTRTVQSMLEHAGKCYNIKFSVTRVSEMG